MIVGNLINHGLYHGLIAVFNMPFLNVEPSVAMWEARVDQVMSFYPLTIESSISPPELLQWVEDLQHRRISHNAFPVVGSDGILVGMITSKQLVQAYADYKKKEGGEPQLQIQLGQFMDRSPLTVHPHTRLGRAYEVFQKMGLRHLPVVKPDGTVLGILTRKNLQTFLLHENSMVSTVAGAIRGKVQRMRTWKATEAREQNASMEQKEEQEEKEALGEPGREEVVPDGRTSIPGVPN